MKNVINVESIKNRVYKKSLHRIPEYASHFTYNPRISRRPSAIHGIAEVLYDIGQYAASYRFRPFDPCPNRRDMFVQSILGISEKACPAKYGSISVMSEGGGNYYEWSSVEE